jgi:hypothetical protein
MVSRLADKAGFPIPNNFRTAAHPENHRRGARRHGLKESVGEVLRNGWQDEDIGRIVVKIHKFLILE